MSIFRRLKEKVTPPKARISLRLDKDSTALGEDIEGALTITSEEEFDAVEIRCEIECTEEAQKTKRKYDEKLGREIEEEVQETATLYSAKPTISGPLKITKGYSAAFPLAVNIPAGGRPTYKAIDRKVTWSIKGVIAVDGRPDVTTATTEIQVVQPSISPVVKEKEVIREIVMIPCKYCGTLMPQTATVCPNCGARRTA